MGFMRAMSLRRTFWLLVSHFDSVILYGKLWLTLLFVLALLIERPDNTRGIAAGIIRGHLSKFIFRSF